ncbi:Helix-turn-helix domain protein [Rubripirellula tenax]|uniref:Helix-turn-helix domain protein n=1 Tax=Rubripirellula tenax TaxID=2528015 RepID=A0A5C6FE96_9BACT|nr:helix-turn-helix domain-containing protein [Rubripirellula tenax]TWU59072.1 Helix-turn-helix domain protein [Rubripirellula tenax]
MSQQKRSTPSGDRTVPAMMSVDDVARELGCSPKHIRRMADVGKIPPFVKLGRLSRMPSEVFAEWLRNGCQPVRKASRSRRQ